MLIALRRESSQSMINASNSFIILQPPPNIIGGVIQQESAGNPNAISHGHGGGAGLMQINHRYRRNVNHYIR
jgi:soluble lytic murein transglycosylase-like protein